MVFVKCNQRDALSVLRLRATDMQTVGYFDSCWYQRHSCVQGCQSITRHVVVKRSCLEFGVFAHHMFVLLASKLSLTLPLLCLSVYL